MKRLMRWSAAALAAVLLSACCAPWGWHGGHRHGGPGWHQGR